jgi:hypothetical protein
VIKKNEKDYSSKQIPNFRKHLEFASKKSTFKSVVSRLHGIGQ